MTEAHEQAGLTPERVFREYAPRVYHLARRMLNNDADAEDVTQEVMLQVVRKLDSFRGDSAFPTWLHRVTVNAALGLRRKRARLEEDRVYDPLDDFSEDGHHGRTMKAWPIQPELLVLNAEQRQQIDQAIAKLPTMYRDVFVLSDVELLPNQQIAELLEMSLPAVKSRLHRARMMMRDFLAPYFEGMSQ